MPIKVFYAWQSDRLRDVCHELIRSAANDAIERLKGRAEGDLVVEDAPPLPDFILDHDTKDVPGIPKVADVIQQKIAECDVFLADLTNVAEYKTDDGRRDKKTPNANVLIELGQALVQKSPQRILSVMNTAFGSFRALPFDLHLHRKPLGYHLANAKDQRKVMDARKELADQLYDAFRLMASHIVTTRRADDAKTAVIEVEGAKKDAERKWMEFYSRIRQYGFHGLHLIPGFTKAPDASTKRPEQEAFLVAAVIPLFSPTMKITLKEIRRHYQRSLVTLGHGNTSVDLVDNAIVSHDGSMPRGYVEGATAAMEMKPDGSFYAVERLGNYDGHSAGWRGYRFEEDERQLYHALNCYVRILRNAGLDGPLYVRILLAGMSGAVFVPKKGSGFWRTSTRPMTKNEIVTDPVILSGESGGRNECDVPEAMRHEMETFWNAIGLDDDPCFDAQGKFVVG